MKPQDRARSWFGTHMNPKEICCGSPEEIVEKVLDLWCEGHSTRTGAAAYCISPTGVDHVHMVLEDSNMARFSALKKIFPTAHIECTVGNKKQAEDYIQKKGKYAEKGETVLYVAHRGEIQGRQGQRTDLDAVPILIAQGYTPEQIMDMNFKLRRYEKEIRNAYYRKRFKETPPYREVFVRWHVGESGTGKSHTFTTLCEQKGDDNVYFLTDYKNGFDKYDGEPILFMDDLKGTDQLTFSRLLTLLDGYRCQVPCRYSNVYAMWTHIEITSVFPPERLFDSFTLYDTSFDSYEQLRRRIDVIVYHWKDGDGNFREHEIPMDEYLDYASMQLNLIELLGKEAFGYDDSCYGVTPSEDYIDLAALLDEMKEN